MVRVMKRQVVIIVQISQSKRKITLHMACGEGRIDVLTRLLQLNTNIEICDLVSVIDFDSDC
jgi:hypothetical protein